MRGIILIDALIALSFLALGRAELKVTQVQVLFRHGERTPIRNELYPKDIHNISVYDAWGLGQLTNKGKMREYQIGRLLRGRYGELLGTLYHPRIIFAYSTDLDRTKMSLQLVLAALFQPVEVQIWNPELPWIPIPIHYAHRPIDILMHQHLCPEYVNVRDQVKQLPEVQEKISEYKDLFRFLSEKTGRNITESTSVSEIESILVSQKGMNLTLPEWATENILEQMRNVADLEYKIRSYTTDLKRLNGGALVKRFIENMRLDGAREDSRKIYLYSGHEVTISAFLKAHGICEPKIPFFGTAVMFEKLEDDDGNRFVKLVLWTGVTEQLITLRLPGCEEVCPIERYLQLTSHVIPTDEEMDCHWRRLSPEELHAITEEKMSYD